MARPVQDRTRNTMEQFRCYGAMRANPRPLFAGQVVPVNDPVLSLQNQIPFTEILADVRSRHEVVSDGGPCDGHIAIERFAPAETFRRFRAALAPAPPRFRLAHDGIPLEGIEAGSAGWT
jgi:hypothetical protein